MVKKLSIDMFGWRKPTESSYSILLEGRQDQRNISMLRFIYHDHNVNIVL